MMKFTTGPEFDVLFDLITLLITSVHKDGKLAVSINTFSFFSNTLKCLGAFICTLFYYFKGD